MAPAARTPSALRPDQLHLYHRNPRNSDVSAIEASLLAHDQYRPIVVNKGTHTGRPHEVLAGNHTLIAIRNLQQAHPDDDRWARVLVHMIDVDDDRASRIVVADNRIPELGSYDDRLLSELLSEIDDLGDLIGTGYTHDDLTSLLHRIDIDTDAIDKEYEDGKNTPAVKRTIPLDMIFSSNSCCWSGALAAYNGGWNPGVISTYITSARRYHATYTRAKPIMFIDNEWQGYEHVPHVAAVSEFRPKYATVRDIVTTDQASAAGVEFYSLAQTLDMAAEIAQYTDNVILIPKYDCLDQLPETIEGKRVVLGYSVASSYGQTDVPPSAFRGRPTHLLGGPWGKQRALLNVIGEDVVSLDNNQLLKIARFGQVACGDGTVRPFNEIVAGASEVTSRTMDAALVLSLTLIMHAVCTEYGNEMPPLVVTEDIDFDDHEH
jgi:hypothetical protein